MEENYLELNKHWDAATFPFFMLDKMKATGACGIRLDKYGGPGLTAIEFGMIAFELAKKDASFATTFMVHNGLGCLALEYLANEEQKQRLIPRGINFDVVIGFALTEPQSGSDISILMETTAAKVDGGYVINGIKRWIGAGTFGDLIVWARNEDDGNKIQGFYVEKGSVGMKTSKIEGKYAARSILNADIIFDNVFVPIKNKIEYATSFEHSAAGLLAHSRLTVGWMAAGVAAGAYEAALKYTLQRI